MRWRPTPAWVRGRGAPSSDSVPPRVRSCLGRSRRLAGHSRVPPPPARIKAKPSFTPGLYTAGSTFGTLAEPDVARLRAHRLRGRFDRARDPPRHDPPASGQPVWHGARARGVL